jgi:hypothetical protein
MLKGFPLLVANSGTLPGIKGHNMNLKWAQQIVIEILNNFNI